MATQVDLGFLEKCSKSYLLTNKFFPSKVGGRPAWLDLEKIPESKTLKCNECNRELVFLCQVSEVISNWNFGKSIFCIDSFAAGLCTSWRTWSLFSSNNLRVHLHKRKLLATKQFQVSSFRLSFDFMQFILGSFFLHSQKYKSLSMSVAARE